MSPSIRLLWRFETLRKAPVPKHELIYSSSTAPFVEFTDSVFPEKKRNASGWGEFVEQNETTAVKGTARNIPGTPHIVPQRRGRREL